MQGNSPFTLLSPGFIGSLFSHDFAMLEIDEIRKDQEITRHSFIARFSITQQKRIQMMIETRLLHVSPAWWEVRYRVLRPIREDRNYTEIPTSGLYRSCRISSGPPIWSVSHQSGFWDTKLLTCYQSRYRSVIVWMAICFSRVKLKAGRLQSRYGCKHRKYPRGTKEHGIALYPLSDKRRQVVNRWQTFFCDNSWCSQLNCYWICTDLWVIQGRGKYR